MILMTWDGERLPSELQSLPPGRYALEPLNEPDALTTEEEADIEAAITSMRRGDLIDGDEAGRRIRSLLR